MTDQPTTAGTVSRQAPWLALGLALLLLSNGRWILPAAGWLFAIGWLVFLDRTRAVSGLTTAFLAFVGAHFVMWWEIIPAPGALYFLIAATYATLYFLPFLAHRLLSPKLTGIRQTLVFPLVWVGVELLISRLTPYGSWASLAYGQSDHLAVLQLASIAGTAGISFLLTWFGSVVARALRPDLEIRGRWSAAVACALVLGLVFGFGEVRLLTGRTGATVRVAALVPSPTAFHELERALAPIRQGREVSPSEMRSLEEAEKRLNHDLLARSRREAESGARLVAWSETAGRVLGEDQDALLQRLSRLAREQEIVLLAALGVFHPDLNPPFENKVVGIEPSGDLAWEFHKAHPIAGAESPFMAAGAGEIRSLETDFGRVGIVICHDLDFPPLLRQASSERIGLLVAPSDDWTVIATLHARMATFRAVENGFTLLRPTNGGRSLAVDPYGRVLARVDFTDDSMVAEVPTKSVTTIYGRVGDLFAWLAVLSVLLLYPSRLLRRTNETSHSAS